MLTELIHILNRTSIAAVPKVLSKYPELLDKIESETAMYEVKNLMHRIYIIINGPPPKCEYGNQLQFDTFTKGYRKGCVKGNKCRCVNTLRKEGFKNTMLDRYGVENPSHLTTVVEKRRQTSIDRYGTDHYTKTSEYKASASAKASKRTKDDWSKIHAKTVATSIKKYGVEHHMKDKTQQAKVRRTTLKRYGVEHPLQDPKIAAKVVSSKNQQQVSKKTRDTMLLRYEVEYPSQIQLSPLAREVLMDSNRFREFIQGRTRNSVCDELGITLDCLYTYAKKYDGTESFAHPPRSRFEVDVEQLVRSLVQEYKVGARDIVPPKEIDIYIPSRKVAIELCGLYWHSENSAGRGKDYHADKFSRCAKQGITLITIFEDEWRDKRSIVEQKIKHILGSNTGPRVYARLCKIVEINPKQANKILTENHIQGAKSGTVNLGLEHNGDIVAVMTFGKPRFVKNTSTVELLRYCTAGGTHVVGGASKLFSYYVKTHKPESVISYSDCRWGSGNMYKHLGMTNAGTTIGYSYTDYKLRYNRIKFQKHKIVSSDSDELKTEWKLMKDRGYDRIWDCGQTKWVWINSK